ncbi:MAG: hypothetical protein C0403_19500 [Desulfobacterium sp.]|nr:hypothetical protein [Desulfobacterium sp.]
MNISKKNPPYQNDRADQKQEKKKENTSLPLARILQELTPSIEDYLKKLSDNQKKIIEADLKIAESVARLTNHIISEKQNIRLHFYPSTVRKKSKKSEDSHHQRIKKIITRMRKKLKTYEEIAQFLEKENIPTFTKQGRWHAQTVHRLFQDYPDI